jgi:hypothetical protein
MLPRLGSAITTNKESASYFYKGILRSRRIPGFPANWRHAFEQVFTPPRTLTCSHGSRKAKCTQFIIGAC